MDKHRTKHHDNHSSRHSSHHRSSVSHSSDHRYATSPASSHSSSKSSRHSERSISSGRQEHHTPNYRDQEDRYSRLQSYSAEKKHSRRNNDHDVNMDVNYQVQDERHVNGERKGSTLLDSRVYSERELTKTKKMESPRSLTSNKSNKPGHSTFNSSGVASIAGARKARSLSAEKKKSPERKKSTGPRLNDLNLQKKLLLQYQQSNALLLQNINALFLLNQKVSPGALKSPVSLKSPVTPPSITSPVTPNNQGIFNQFDFSNTNKTNMYKQLGTIFTKSSGDTSSNQSPTQSKCSDQLNIHSTNVNNKLVIPESCRTDKVNISKTQNLNGNSKQNTTFRTTIEKPFPPVSHRIAAPNSTSRIAAVPSITNRIVATPHSTNRIAVTPSLASRIGSTTSSTNHVAAMPSSTNHSVATPSLNNHISSSSSTNRIAGLSTSTNRVVAMPTSTSRILSLPESFLSQKVLVSKKTGQSSSDRTLNVSQNKSTPSNIALKSRGDGKFTALKNSHVICDEKRLLTPKTSRKDVTTRTLSGNLSQPLQNVLSNNKGTDVVTNVTKTENNLRHISFSRKSSPPTITFCDENSVMLLSKKEIVSSPKNHKLSLSEYHKRRRTASQNLSPGVDDAISNAVKATTTASKQSPQEPLAATLAKDMSATSSNLYPRGDAKQQSLDSQKSDDMETQYQAFLESIGSKDGKNAPNKPKIDKAPNKSRNDKAPNKPKDDKTPNKPKGILVTDSNLDALQIQSEGIITRYLRMMSSNENSNDNEITVPVEKDSTTDKQFTGILKTTDHKIANSSEKPKDGSIRCDETQPSKKYESTRNTDEKGYNFPLRNDSEVLPYKESVYTSKAGEKVIPTEKKNSTKNFIKIFPRVEKTGQIVSPFVKTKSSEPVTPNDPFKFDDNNCDQVLKSPDTNKSSQSSGKSPASTSLVVSTSKESDTQNTLDHKKDTVEGEPLRSSIFTIVTTGKRQHKATLKKKAFLEELNSQKSRRNKLKEKSKPTEKSDKTSVKPTNKTRKPSVDKPSKEVNKKVVVVSKDKKNTKKHTVVASEKENLNTKTRKTSSSKNEQVVVHATNQLEDTTSMIKPTEITFNTMVKTVINSPAVQKKFKCKTCGAEFWKEQDLSKHSLIHKMRTYDCYKCVEKFTTMRALTKHLLIHEETGVVSTDRPHDCEKCGEKFETENQLLVHLRIHEKKETEHACVFCSVKYQHLSELYNHISKSHPEGMQQVLRCSHCGTCFNKLGEFRSHLMTSHKMNSKEASLACRNKGLIPEEYKQAEQERIQFIQAKKRAKGLLLRSGITVKVSTVGLKRKPVKQTRSGTIPKNTASGLIKAKAVLQKSKKVKRYLKQNELTRGSSRTKVQNFNSEDVKTVADLTSKKRSQEGEERTSKSKSSRKVDSVFKTKVPSKKLEKEEAVIQKERKKIDSAVVDNTVRHETMLPASLLESIYNRVEKTKNLKKPVTKGQTGAKKASPKQAEKGAKQATQEESDAQNKNIAPRKPSLVKDLDQLRNEEQQKLAKLQFESAERTARMLIRNQRRSTDDIPKNKRRKPSTEKMVNEAETKVEPLRLKVHIKMSDFVNQTTATLITSSVKEGQANETARKTNKKRKGSKKRPVIKKPKDPSAKAVRKRSKYYIYEDELRAMRKEPNVLNESLDSGIGSLPSVLDGVLTQIVDSDTEPSTVISGIDYDKEYDYSKQSEEVFLTEDELLSSLLTLSDEAVDEGVKNKMQEAVERKIHTDVRLTLDDILNYISACDIPTHNELASGDSTPTFEVFTGFFPLPKDDSNAVVSSLSLSKDVVDFSCVPSTGSEECYTPSPNLDHDYFGFVPCNCVQEANLLFSSDLDEKFVDGTLKQDNIQYVEQNALLYETDHVIMKEVSNVLSNLLQLISNTCSKDSKVIDTVETMEEFEANAKHDGDAFVDKSGDVSVVSGHIPDDGEKHVPDDGDNHVRFSKDKIFTYGGDKNTPDGEDEYVLNVGYKHVSTSKDNHVSDGGGKCLSDVYYDEDKNLPDDGDTRGSDDENEHVRDIPNDQDNHDQDDKNKCGPDVKSDCESDDKGHVSHYENKKEPAGKINELCDNSSNVEVHVNFSETRVNEISGTSQTESMQRTELSVEDDRNTNKTNKTGNEQYSNISVNTNINALLKVDEIGETSEGETCEDQNVHIGEISTIIEVDTLDEVRETLNAACYKVAEICSNEISKSKQASITDDSVIPFLIEEINTTASSLDKVKNKNTTCHQDACDISISHDDVSVVLERLCDRVNQVVESDVNMDVIQVLDSVCYRVENLTKTLSYDLCSQSSPYTAELPHQSASNPVGTEFKHVDCSKDQHLDSFKNKHVESCIKNNAIGRSSNCANETCSKKRKLNIDSNCDITRCSKKVSTSHRAFEFIDSFDLHNFKIKTEPKDFDDVELQLNELNEIPIELITEINNNFPHTFHAVNRNTRKFYSCDKYLRKEEANVYFDTSIIENNSSDIQTSGQHDESIAANDEPYVQMIEKHDKHDKWIVESNSSVAQTNGQQDKSIAKNESNIKASGQRDKSIIETNNSDVKTREKNDNSIAVNVKSVVQTSLQNIRENGNNSHTCKCHFCQRTFPRHSLYRTHLLHHHDIEERISCKICKNTFKRRRDKISHVCVKTFNCSTCGEKFSSSKRLLRHQLFRHSNHNNNAYKCSICARTFLRPSYLATHKRSHPTLFPHKCLHCGKSFNKKFDLRKHETTHGTTGV
ncbi:uncharacterized protein LOC130644779 [Hydractinia symbiolongicarpus]|uniref:uncharacterized protein LOC130644779 n=1 Tax=Hydractinia symbiolongicarpus TaxID=13093 RepID=UPI00254F20BD|nr:uncharacterized protein LOC130644779 [Hydractinia symbiolongicarpus]